MMNGKEGKNMRAVDIIIKKRDHEELSREEIEFFVHGFVNGAIPDYQVSAWAMAILLNGMTPQETTELTLAMASSGDQLDMRAVVPIAVDKHSTGGVGDKVTLIIAPTVAACGLPVGKMSGRGLGFSGGTLDKLESIPGFRANLTTEEFMTQLQSIGIVVSGQSADLAPADGKLYALRDVTGTVPSIPLIASSVMSKKIAAGAQAILLDVKMGHGAFMETLESARELASLMVSIGKLTGRRTAALLSDMNQPLGYAVGNVLELLEAINTLQGKGPIDLYEHCLVVCSHLLVLGQKASSLEQGREMAEKTIQTGRAWAKFREWIQTQGGDVRFVDEPDRLAVSNWIETVPAPRSGYIVGIDAREVGETSVELGAGRAKKEDQIDHAVGVVIHAKVGDRLEEGQPLFTIHANDPKRLAEARRRLILAHHFQDDPCQPLPLFYGVVE
jgi:pyrimidine-nucleoside phosphorylase